MRITMHAAQGISGTAIEGKHTDWDELVPNYHKYYPDSTWKPPVNLYEGTKCYYIVVDLSGTDASEIGLDVTKSDLTISGERHTPQPGKSENHLQMHHMEINHGRFSRALDMPRGVDLDNISAVYCKGQLTIRLPKTKAKKKKSPKSKQHGGHISKKAHHNPR